jgi:hypothetical protein
VSRARHGGADAENRRGSQEPGQLRTGPSNYVLNP